MFKPLSSNPYFDDFDPQNPYYRILFKPEYAVQARELTQIQTLIQEQIKRFGDNIFKDGTSVSGGNFTFETNLLSIKLSNTYLGSGVSSNNFIVNSTITGVTSGSIGIIKKIISATNTDPLTVIVKLFSGDSFTAGEQINYVANTVTYSTTILPTLPFNSCVLFNITSGIFYLSGFFVKTDSESIVVDKYSNTNSYKVGFSISEGLTTSDDDGEKQRRHRCIFR